MEYFVVYNIDKDLYYAPDTKHNVSLATTEYFYKNEILVHVQIGTNLGIRLNNLIRYDFNKDKILQNEQFMYRKSYQKKDKTKIVTRGTFEDKMKRFDINKTVKEQEIIEEYSYINKNNRSDTTQIAITIKDNIMTATISFKDIEQCKNFIYPVWFSNVANDLVIENN